MSRFVVRLTICSLSLASVLLLAACTGGKPDATPTYVDFVVVNVAPTPTYTPVAAPTVAATTYTVQPGDTLIGIATQFGVTVDDLARANGIADDKRDQLQVGQVLIIPPRVADKALVTATPLP